MDLYSITVHYLCCFIPFLIISTNLFPFWSQQATDLAFSLTGQPFSLFDWFPVLIACQSVCLTQVYTRQGCHIASWLLSKTSFKQNAYFSWPVTLKNNPLRHSITGWQTKTYSDNLSICISHGQLIPCISFMLSLSLCGTRFQQDKVWSCTLTEQKMFEFCLNLQISALQSHQKLLSNCWQSIPTHI